MRSSHPHSSPEYVRWMADVWKANNERNQNAQMLPDGVTSYRAYCADLRSRGRTPLPYETVWEIYAFQDIEEDR